MTTLSDTNKSPRKPRHTREINYTGHKKLTPRHQAFLSDEAARLIRQMCQGGIKFSCAVLNQLAGIIAEASTMWNRYGKRLFEIHYGGQTAHWPEPARTFLIKEFRTVSPYRLAKDLDNKKSQRIFKQLVELLLRQAKVVITPKDAVSTRPVDYHANVRDTRAAKKHASKNNQPLIN